MKRIAINLAKALCECSASRDSQPRVIQPNTRASLSPSREHGLTREQGHLVSARLRMTGRVILTLRAS